MAHLKFEDRKVELVEDWRVGELIEAENALGIDMDEAKGAAKRALIFYISMRRADASTPQGVLADQVLRLDIANLEEDEEDDAAPLGAEANGDAAQEIGARLTTGSPPSATTST